MRAGTTINMYLHLAMGSKNTKGTRSVVPDSLLHLAQSIKDLSNKIIGTTRVVTIQIRNTEAINSKREARTVQKIWLTIRTNITKP